MIDVPDLTEAELAFRALLQRPAAFSRWARETREAWARTPVGQRALAESEAKTGKKRRRVDLESRA